MLLHSTAAVLCRVRQRYHVLLALIVGMIAINPAAINANGPLRSTAATTCPTSTTYSELIQCSIVSAAEFDSYTFSANIGDELLIRAGTASGDLRPNLRLYRPDGIQACANANPYSPLVEIVACRITVSGTHRLEISDTQGTRTGSYGIQIERLNPPANATGLVLAQTTTGAILSASELDSYTFSASSGDRLVLRMGITNGTLRPYLRLYNAAGLKVCEGGSQYGSMAEIADCTITANGSYTLILADYGNVRSGSYGLHVQRVSAPLNATVLPIAQSNVAAILSAGELDTYSLTTATPGPIMMRVGVANGTLRPYLRVYGAEGTLICTGGSQYGVMGEISSCLLPQAGTYTVLISDYGDVRTGTYHIMWQRLVNPANPTPLTIGQHTSGTLTTAGQFTTYSFTATAGSTVIARMGMASGTLRPYLRLYTPQGAKLCEAGTSYNDTAESLVCALTDGGTYTLILSDYGDVRTDSYGVLIQRFNGPVSATPLTAGQTVAATLSAAGDFHSYRFSAKTGDQLTLRLGVTSGTLRPHLRVYTAGGAKLCEAGSSYAKLVEIAPCVAPETGEYVVLVSDYGGSRSGTYSLFFQNLTSPEQPNLRYVYLPLMRR